MKAAATKAAALLAILCLGGAAAGRLEADAPEEPSTGQAGVSRPAAAPPVPGGRAPLDITPLHYQLTVMPDFGTATFDGDLTIDIQVDKATTRITLDAVDLEIYDAEILLPFDRQVKPVVTTDSAAGTVDFTTTTRLNPGAIKLHVQYGGKLRNDGRGFYLARSNGRKYLLSQMEATDARRAFPCIDDPAYKASFALSAIVDQRLTAISNGKLMADTPAEKFGKHVLRFGTTPRMSTYLVALAVGEFACLDAAAEAIPIRVCATPEKKDRGAFVLEAARRALQFDSRYFTFKYPFRKLDLLAVPGGFPGAMENTAAIFFDEGLLEDAAEAPETRLAEVAVAISHEVAHQWLGNVVTMRWWDDLWMNEGMATWLAPKAVAAWKPEWNLDLEGVVGASKAMRLDAFPSARPVRAAVSSEAEIEESFDAMAYEKAAAVLRMVESWIGEDAFRGGVNEFVRTHAYGNATAEDLWAQLASADKPVDQVMRAFITRPGVPVVNVDAACEGNETVVTASVGRYSLDGIAAAEAAVPADGGAPPAPRPAGQASDLRVPTLPPAAPWPTPLQLRGINATAPMLTFTPRLLSEQPQSFRIGGCFPAVFANSGALGYFHTAYRPAALAQLTAVAAARMTTTERIRLLDDQWALAASGASAIGDYLSVVAALASDRTPEVIEAVALGLAFLREHVVNDADRERFEAWIRKTIGPAAAAVGWQAAASDTEDRRRLRAALMDVMGSAGRDPEALAAAHALAAAEVAGARSLDRPLASTASHLAARSADASLLAKLRARDEAETLAAAGDAAFVTRALEEALKDAGNREALPGLIAAALENPAVNAPVLRLVTSRWSDIEPALGNPFALGQIVAAAGSFCDAGARDGVKRFFADRAAAVGRTLQLTLERIDACRDFRLRQERALSEWVRGTRTPS